MITEKTLKQISLSSIEDYFELMVELFEEGDYVECSSLYLELSLREIAMFEDWLEQTFDDSYSLTIEDFRKLNR